MALTCASCPARSAWLHKKSHYADVGEQFSLYSTALSLKVSSQIGFDGKKTQLSFAKVLANRSELKLCPRCRLRLELRIALFVETSPCSKQLNTFSSERARL